MKRSLKILAAVVFFMLTLAAVSTCQSTNTTFGITYDSAIDNNTDKYTNQATYVVFSPDSVKIGEATFKQVDFHRCDGYLHYVLKFEDRVFDFEIHNNYARLIEEKGGIDVTYINGEIKQK